MSSAFGRYVRRHHLALLALFVALGGTAYAAVELERNQVKSRHIGPGQVKKPDIAARAVNSAKVADRTLRGIDFAPGQLPTGAQGATGATGATGTTGPAGLTSSDALHAGNVTTVNSCNEGTLRELQVNVTEPSRILAIGQSKAAKAGNEANQVALEIKLLDSSSTVIGFLERYHVSPVTAGVEYPLTAVGLIKELAFGSPVLTLQPGSYTLQLVGDNANACAGSVGYAWSSLDYVLLGSG